MKANVQIQKTSEKITNAVNVFLELEVFMKEEWNRILLRVAHHELAKAWFPWTKSYWRKRIETPALLEGNKTYYNSPSFHYWAQRNLEAIKVLSHRYSCARNSLSAGEIILNNDELDLLIAVDTAKSIMAGETK